VVDPGRYPLDESRNIDRYVPQGGALVAQDRVRFCLDQIEKYGFSDAVEWDSNVNERLSLEEVIGALVASEQVLRYTILGDNCPLVGTHSVHGLRVT